jgi:hypothetical protein
MESWTASTPRYDKPWAGIHYMNDSLELAFAIQLPPCGCSNSKERNEEYFSR